MYFRNILALSLMLLGTLGADGVTSSSPINSAPTVNQPPNPSATTPPPSSTVYPNQKKNSPGHESDSEALFKQLHQTSPR